MKRNTLEKRERDSTWIVAKSLHLPSQAVRGVLATHLLQDAELKTVFHTVRLPVSTSPHPEAN